MELSGAFPRFPGKSNVLASLLIVSLLAGIQGALAAPSTEEQEDIFNAVSHRHRSRAETLLKQDPLLLEQHADGSPGSPAQKGETPLMMTVHAHGLEDMTQFLIDHGANVNATNDVGETCLHLAAKYDRFDKAPLLIKANAEVNAADKFGSTPLMEAVWRESQATVKILLEARAKPDIKSNKGFTALGMARHQGFKEIEALLLKAGAKDYGTEP